jgi:hypothetical protein
MAPDRRSASAILFGVNLTALALPSIHLYLSPTYNMDFVQYMENVLLMEERDG